ncbi:MAG TPA: MBOAT family protein, partial [Bacteroidia bacterium]|nr:MBOAT family protein [Bacteroidia bacterium]
FLPLALLAYYLCPNRFKNYLLLILSIGFYSWGAPRFIFVILGTTLLDFFLVRLMHKQQKRSLKRLLLILSVCMNVGLLFYFKYANFFIANFNNVLSALGLAHLNMLAVVLPIGISFYTFESLTYVVDVYRGEHTPLKNFLHYQLYIILFPKLIAGPIIRYKDIADQITGRFQTFTYSSALQGMHRFILGLAKKVIIANTLGSYADLVFNCDVASLNSAAAWLGALSYTLQIYFDFSGYSDMAIGIGQMLGFRFPENFNNPYTSLSITDFWRRWHMTLGAWMRNYLYIPLGGNRVSSKRRLYFNLWIVFVLSGFWHGASWGFIVWGIYHGTFLILERMAWGRLLQSLGKWPAMLITFGIVNIGWIFFKEESLSGALHFIRAMFAFHRPEVALSFNMRELYTILTLALFFSFFAAVKVLERIQQRIYFLLPSALESIAYTGISALLLLVCVSHITASSFNPFIYFRF